MIPGDAPGGAGTSHLTAKAKLLWTGAGACLALALGAIILFSPAQAPAVISALAEVVRQETVAQPPKAVAPAPADTPTPQATPTATPAPTATATAAPTATLTPSPTLTFVPAARVKVPILMYHYIRVNPNPADKLGFNLSVTPANFEAQMEYLRRHGYQTISFARLIAYFDGLAPLPPKPIILTFDDGYRDFYTSAYPILKKLGQTGTVFVPTSFVGRPGYLTAEQIIEMAQGGIEFGGHTARHVDLRRAAGPQVKAELNDSKQTLELLLGSKTLAFSYPAGGYDEAAIAQVKAAGYRVAVTTQHGVWHRQSDLLAAPRGRISGSTTVSGLASLIGE